MKYRHHKYTWSKSFSSVRHNWEFVGRYGGMNFHVSLPGPGEKSYFDVSAGLEIHYTRPPPHMNEDPPSQIRCWLLDCPCWHDGTSLYATEHLWPIIESYLRTGDHEMVFRLLESDADGRFKQFTCEEAVS